LLIAATMLSVLFIGLGAHLRGGISVWRRATDVGERLQRQRVAIERLEQDLANAVLYDSRAASYGSAEGLLPVPEWTSDALALLTVAPATGPAAAIRFVTHRCEAVDGASGWRRTSQALGEARLKRRPAPELLLPGCEALSLRYAVVPSDSAQPVEWVAEWNVLERGLPRLVELTARLADGSQMRRRFAIPAGGSV
jgi:hypothetical protein